MSLQFESKPLLTSEEPLKSKPISYYKTIGRWEAKSSKLFTVSQIRIPIYSIRDLLGVLLGLALPVAFPPWNKG